MWADRRRTYSRQPVSWWPWWLALLTFVIGIVVGMRLSGGPLRLGGLLRQAAVAVTPAAAPVRPDSRTGDRPSVVDVRAAPQLPRADADLPRVAADAPLPPSTREVFLCKSHAGVQFWSDGRCDAQRATIERIVTVPGRLAWGEALALAEQQKRAAEALYSTAHVATTAGAIGTGSVSSAGAGECGALDTQILRIEAAARQPQSAQEQDRLRAAHQRVRSRQAELRC